MNRRGAENVEELQVINLFNRKDYRRGKWPIALLINFNVPIMSKGIKQLVHRLR